MDQTARALRNQLWGIDFHQTAETDDRYPAAAFAPGFFRG